MASTSHWDTLLISGLGNIVSAWSRDTPQQLVAGKPVVLGYIYWDQNQQNSSPISALAPQPATCRNRVHSLGRAFNRQHSQSNYHQNSQSSNMEYRPVFCRQVPISVAGVLYGSTLQSIGTFHCLEMRSHCMQTTAVVSHRKKHACWVRLQNAPRNKDTIQCRRNTAQYLYYCCTIILDGCMYNFTAAFCSTLNA